MEKVSRKRRRIRFDRLLVLLGGCVLAAVLLFGGIWAVMNLFNKDIIAEPYATASTDNKLEGEKILDSVYEEKIEGSEETLVYAIHLPSFSDESLTEKVNAFVDGLKAEKNRVTHIDFSSSQAFNQYKSYVIKATTYSDMDGLSPINPVGTQTLYINLDNDTPIELEDCIRWKAIDLLAHDYGCEEENVQLVSINEQGIVIDVNGTQMDYKYDEHNTYFEMNNSNVPSILKYDKIEVEKREIDPNKPMVAFTFDDGPSPGNTERLLKALDEVNGRATFFELGSLMEIYPDTVRAIVEQGSEVANHSYSHEYLSQMTTEDMKANVQKVNDIFYSITGQDIRLLRPPGGFVNQNVRDNLSEGIVMWDVDTRDWESRNTQSVIEMTKKYTYDGAIVLFHDIHKTTIPAAEELIRYYDSLGYQFVTVSELYEAKGK